MINREKAMTDFINAACRLDFHQLLIAQAHLAEHILNCFEHTKLQKERLDIDAQKPKH